MTLLCFTGRHLWVPGQELPAQGHSQRHLLEVLRWLLGWRCFLKDKVLLQQRCKGRPHLTRVSRPSTLSGTCKVTAAGSGPLTLSGHCEVTVSDSGPLTLSGYEQLSSFSLSNHQNVKVIPKVQCYLRGDRSDTALKCESEAYCVSAVRVISSLTGTLRRSVRKSHFSDLGGT